MRFRDARLRVNKRCLPPPAPVEPAPADGGVSVSLNTDLLWSIGDVLAGAGADEAEVSMIAEGHAASGPAGEQPVKLSAAPNAAEAPPAPQTDPVRILAFTLYADQNYGGEYENTFAAMSLHFTNFLVNETTTLDPETLRAQLAGTQVFLIPEQEYWDEGSMAAWGSSIAGVLVEFVTEGGIVIVSDHLRADDFVNATGLMAIGDNSYTTSTRACRVVELHHAVMEGVAPFFDAGVAWRDGVSPSFSCSGNDDVILVNCSEVVASVGIAGRLNLLGFLIMELDFVNPITRPDKGWFFQFSLLPAF